MFTDVTLVKPLPRLLVASPELVQELLVLLTLPSPLLFPTRYPLLAGVKPYKILGLRRPH